MLERLLTATAKKSYVALFDQALVSGTNFLTGVLLARLCSKEQYGFYVLALSLLFFVDGLRHSFVGVPFVISLPHKPREEQPAYVGATTVLHALLLLGGALVFGAAAGIIGATGSAPLATVVLAGVVTLLGYSSREQVRRFFYAQLRVRRTVLVDGAYCVLQLGALTVLWQLELLTAVNALLTLGAVQITAALFGFMLLWGTTSFRNLKLRSVLSSHWKLGKWLVANSLVFATTYQVYPWLLNYTWGEESIATLGACRHIVFLANPFILGFRNILVPRMAHVFSAEGLPGLRRVTHKGLMAIIMVMGPFAIAVALLAEPILELMYGGKYSGNGLIVALMSVNIIIHVLAVPFSSALAAVERTDVPFYSSLGAVVVTLFAGYPLTKAWGLPGVMLAVISSNTVFLCMVYYFYRIVIVHKERRNADSCKP